jgi:glutamine amidotransferase
MCRHLAYWGPPISPATVVLDAPNSLLDQCTAAREMSWGQDNLDGWGMAWSDDDRVRHHRRGVPLTEDLDGQQRLRSITAPRFVVHVRQMTPGSVRDDINSAPFRDGNRFFTHNGYVADFGSGVREQLLAKVSPVRASGIRGDTDSEMLFALVLSRLDDGATAVESLGVIAEVAELYGGRYNVLLWDGDTIVGTRWENSLYVRSGPAVLISSEPLDDDGWCPVPERSMVIMTTEGIEVEGF